MFGDVRRSSVWRDPDSWHTFPEGTILEAISKVTVDDEEGAPYHFVTTRWIYPRSLPEFPIVYCENSKTPSETHCAPGSAFKPLDNGLVNVASACTESILDYVTRESSRDAESSAFITPQERYDSYARAFADLLVSTWTKHVSSASWPDNKQVVQAWMVDLERLRALMKGTGRIDAREFKMTNEDVALAIYEHSLQTERFHALAISAIEEQDYGEQERPVAEEDITEAGQFTVVNKPGESTLVIWPYIHQLTFGYGKLVLRDTNPSAPPLPRFVQSLLEDPEKFSNEISNLSRNAGVEREFKACMSEESTTKSLATSSVRIAAAERIGEPLVKALTELFKEHTKDGEMTTVVKMVDEDTYRRTAGQNGMQLPERKKRKSHYGT